MVFTESLVIYLAVVVKANNITCRSSLDTGAGSSYTSSAYLRKLNIQTVRKENKQTEMKMHSIVRNFDVFEVEIEDLSGSFQFQSKINKVQKAPLLLLPNSNNEVVLKQRQQ